MTATNRLRVNKRRNGTKVVVGHRPALHVPNSKGLHVSSSDKDIPPHDQRESILDCEFMNQEDYPYFQLEDTNKLEPSDDLLDLNVQVTLWTG